MPRFLQFLIALFSLLLSLPLFFLAVALSSLFIGFPPFHKSIRLGLMGEKYTHLKILTMKPGPSTGRIFFEAGRLNWCGKLLRRLHLDEIPELFQILTGRMNLVGPRPLPPILLDGLDTAVRHSVKPGWTGPAQVVLARRGRLGKKLQIRLDNHYVKNRSALYDIKIIAATFAAVFKGKPLDMGTDSTPDRVAFRKRTCPPSRNTADL